MLMKQTDYQKLLQFSDRWLQLGVLTEDNLLALGREYEVSEDKNTEHYRYRVFSTYLASHRPLSREMAEAFYELGSVDPDRTMGEAMMSDVVGLAECPAEVLEKALASREKHLVKAARRRMLLTELNSGLTADIFARCMESQDAVIQREMLNRPELSREQLEQLEASGSSRAIRNIAAERLAGRLNIRSNPYC